MYDLCARKKNYWVNQVLFPYTKKFRSRRYVEPAISMLWIFILTFNWFGINKAKELTWNREKEEKISEYACKWLNCLNLFFFHQNSICTISSNRQFSLSDWKVLELRLFRNCWCIKQKRNNHILPLQWYSILCARIHFRTHTHTRLLHGRWTFNNNIVYWIDNGIGIGAGYLAASFGCMFKMTASTSRLKQLSKLLLVYALVPYSRFEGISLASEYEKSKYSWCVDWIKAHREVAQKEIQAATLWQIDSGI